MENTPFNLPRQSVEGQDVIFERQKMDEEAFKKIIRKMGLKITHQRLAILSALHDGYRHVTAQEVYEKVSVNHSDIGFATVYRFLRKLVESHLVSEVRMGGLPARYELSPQQHHDHITCIQCGKIFEFECAEIERLQKAVALRFDFKLTGHVLELYGVCLNCQSSKSEMDH